MRPAAAKAPFDYLFAIAVSVTVFGTSFALEPADTKWVVMAVGIAMTLACLVAAARPVRD